MIIKPAARISLGLIALSVTLILIADLMLGFFPNESQWIESTQLHAAESLAIQSGLVADRPDALAHTLRAMVSRDSSMLSVALRDAQGHLVAVAGEHEKYWKPIVQDVPHKGRFSIPMYRESVHWGDMEIVYRSALEPGWIARFMTPTIGVAAALISIAFLGHFLYLRRVLQHLDPSSAVPERVRLAFNALTEGVMVLDASGRVVLTNNALDDLLPKEAVVIGKRPSQLPWLTASLQREAREHPWAVAMAEHRAVTGQHLSFALNPNNVRRVIINCAPILDAGKLARGCLVTFDDVTALDHANTELRRAVSKLNDSQKEIETANAKLKRLATRDPLTGCLNRRAFFELAEPSFSQARMEHEEMCCIMGDIDHFKRFNDQYGHSVGDQVIIAVASTMGAGLRSFDLLCRYGGEEFCILLPNAKAAQAMEIAERIRAAVEHTAGSTIRTMDGLKITSSFGVATLRDEAEDLGGLIDQADEALYRSKEGGRNRVTLWTRTLMTASRHAEPTFEHS